MQQGAAMTSEKKNSMNKGDHSDSTSKAKPQPAKYPDQKRPDFKTDSTQRNPGTAPTKFDKQNRSEDRTKKSSDSNRDSEEQVTDPKEFTKKHKTDYNGKSDRV